MKPADRIYDSTKSVFTNGLPVNGLALCATKNGPGWQALFLLPGQRRYLAHQKPAYPNFTPAGNAVERVGTSFNDDTLLSIAWVGHDLGRHKPAFQSHSDADLCNYESPNARPY